MGNDNSEENAQTLYSIFNRVSNDKFGRIMI